MWYFTESVPRLSPPLCDVGVPCTPDFALVITTIIATAIATGTTPVAAVFFFCFVFWYYPYVMFDPKIDDVKILMVFQTLRLCFIPVRITS